MDKLIKDYLDTKKDMWTDKTIQATASRLKQANKDHDAKLLYRSMKEAGYKPYYIKITFISLSGLADWLMTQGRVTFLKNPYSCFLEEEKQLFRNAYEDKYATITWEDYQRELETSDATLFPALVLLGYGGCRLSELYTFDGLTVLGKGSKRRPAYVPNQYAHLRVSLSPAQVYRRLNYNPHAYRKLAADFWLRNGIDIKTVQTLLGHTSLASTQRYLRPLEQDQLQEKLNSIWSKTA